MESWNEGRKTHARFEDPKTGMRRAKVSGTKEDPPSLPGPRPLAAGGGTDGGVFAVAPFSVPGLAMAQPGIMFISPANTDGVTNASGGLTMHQRRPQASPTLEKHDFPRRWHAHNALCT